MSKFVLPTIITAATSIGGASLIALQGRQECRKNIKKLDKINEMLNVERTEAYGEAKTAKQREYLDLQRDEDALWYKREKTIQEEWLKRPFYKQLGFTPFPDYANVK